MRIRFLQDYRGHLTGEMFFNRNDEVDDTTLPTAAALVAEGRAEDITPESPAQGDDGEGSDPPADPPAQNGADGQGTPTATPETPEAGSTTSDALPSPAAPETDLSGEVQVKRSRK
jgi:hypothetical protein